MANVEDIERVRKHVGVCPQHNDSLHGEATCREMLTLFAKLKGSIPTSQGQTKEEAIDAEVEHRLKEIQFTSEEDADKPIDSYSGGMKRKVCIALAFLGDPEVCYLDEPTAGKLWGMSLLCRYCILFSSSYLSAIFWYRSRSLQSPADLGHDYCFEAREINCANDSHDGRG